MQSGLKDASNSRNAWSVKAVENCTEKERGFPQKFDVLLKFDVHVCCVVVLFHR